MIRVTIDDVHDFKYCNRGSRQMLDQLGYDWSDFLANGIAIEELELVDDAMVSELCKFVRARKG